MTTMDQIHRIRMLYYEQDKTLAEIADTMHLDWRTVRKYVDMEDFNPSPPVPEKEVPHRSKLDPFKPLIDEWLTEWIYRCGETASPVNWKPPVRA